MSSNFKYFKKKKEIPIDKFFEDVLYNSKYGYYNKEFPFGAKGDFITSPSISSLFGEMIAIWMIAFWENLKKPKKFNIVELGPGDAKLTKVLLNTFKKFPQFNKSFSLFLYEKSYFLKKIQRKHLIKEKIKWISNLNRIDNGPTIFFGNEFLDAIPIKQFKRINKTMFEKYIILNKQKKIQEIFKKAKKKYLFEINKFKTLKKSNFIEYPRLGFKTLELISRKVKKNGGGILLIDYGYIKHINLNTLQSVKNHKKNNLFENLGCADITSLVNFSLLKEFFLKKNLNVEKVVTQSFFLKRLGIINRAEILSSKMNFKEKSSMYLRLKRLMDPNLMGNLFKVIFAYKKKNEKINGFY